VILNLSFGISLIRGLGCLLCVCSLVALAYDWGPTRIFYKRAKADNIYVYDEIRPEHRAEDPNTHITVRSQKEVDQLREGLQTLVWGPGADPTAIRPAKVIYDVLNRPTAISDCDKVQSHVTAPKETLLVLRCQLDLYRRMPAIQQIDELIVSVGDVYETSVAYFSPSSPNGTLVVYQNGYASTYHHQYRHIERLVDNGFTVAALNHTGYGETVKLCEPGNIAEGWCSIGWGSSNKPLPMRVHFSPIAAVIGHALDRGEITSVAMLGFSAGAWLTVVASAMDERIQYSYPIAGFMPRFLREDRWHEDPPNQNYKPYMAMGSILDQFIAGADMPGRRQVQFFNQYDRCCYRNRRALLYRDAVANTSSLLGGSFDVRIDAKHPRHKISTWALEEIIKDLGQISKADEAN
jgi:pimeloyl-ACP methyl ester carboxylesterase